jgi:hypothetical protein
MFGEHYGSLLASSGVLIDLENKLQLPQLSTNWTHFSLIRNLSNNSKSLKNQKKLQLRKSFQITPSFSTNLLGTFLIPGLFFLGIFRFWQLFARRKKIQSDGPPISGVEASAGPACRREQGKSMTRADRTQRHRAPLKARLFRPGQSERGRLSPHRHRLIHTSETSSTPLTSPFSQVVAVPCEP